MHPCYPSTWALPLLLLSSLTATAPTSSEKPVSFKVHRVESGYYKEETAEMTMVKTYRKYHWHMPKELPIAAAFAREKIANAAPQPGVYDKAVTSGQGRTVGNIGLIPQPAHTEYLAPVTIGGNFQVQMDIDTGSADTWVFNTRLPAAQQKGHRLYNPDASKSWSQNAGNGDAFSINYGDKSSLTGTVGTDSVRIGGVTVDRQCLQLPSSVSATLVTDQSDGILGLAFSSINSVTSGGKPDPQATWFENVLPRLKEPLFTANLKDRTNGHFEFGSVDTTSYQQGTEQVVTVNNSTGYWGFESASYAIGNGAPQANSGSSLGIADSGSSLLYVDPAVVNAYYASIPKIADVGSSNAYDMKTFLCEYSSTLPDFKFAVGNQMATIPGAYLTWKEDTAQGRCVGAIQSNGRQPGQGPQTQVFGDVFFRVYFLIFNIETMQITFAPHA